MTTLTQEEITLKKSEMEIYAHHLSTGIAVANISNHPNLYQMGLLEGFATYIGRYADPLATEKVKLNPIPKWANPYLMDRWDGERDGDRPTVLRKYLDYFLASPDLIKDSRNLMGKDKEHRLEVLRIAKEANPIYCLITVYEGDRSGDGKETTKGYQLNRKLKDYESEIEEVFRVVKREGGYITAYN